MQYAGRIVPTRKWRRGHLLLEEFPSDRQFVIGRSKIVGVLDVLLLMFASKVIVQKRFNSTGTNMFRTRPGHKLTNASVRRNLTTPVSWVASFLPSVTSQM